MDHKVFQQLNRQAAAEGIVLLKNEEEMLPLKHNEKIAVYGRPQLEYYRSGTGSGGAVVVPYQTNLIDGLNTYGVQVDSLLKETYAEWILSHPFDNGGGAWAAEPWYQQDMPLTEEITERAAARTCKALYVMGRTAGEDQDNQKAGGSWYLTTQEKENLEMILKYHEHTAVLLNVSNIIDMSWLEKVKGREHIQAVAYLWQGGIEGGISAGAVLSGKVSPSGKLPDTIAYQIEDYPSDANFGGRKENIYMEDIYVGYRYFETFDKKSALFPFGFGLGYTQFDTEVLQTEQTETIVRFLVKVTNIGDRYDGREVVQLYYEAPQGLLGKPVRQLGAFAKTSLLKPGACCEVSLEVPIAAMASYDDSGCTGYRSAYVLEGGIYHFYLGDNVRDANWIRQADFLIPETRLVKQLEEAAAPRRTFERLKPGERKEGQTEYTDRWEPVPIGKTNLKERIRNRLPKEIGQTGNQGITLQQVRDGKADLDSFIAQLTKEEMAIIVRGEGMCHPKVTKGTASAFGGVSDSLLAYGIPLACCADGPSGIRMEAESVQLPIGTMLASTWDPKLVQALYSCEGQLLLENQIDTLLGPGINIHRHPLNGRNFEYYSEDPYLTGRMAAAMVKGLRAGGASGTVKHFACNSQESCRRQVEAVCSERALREIYLKGFEMAVGTGDVLAIMTAYNPLNGYWMASHYDLNTTILRKEWGYTGMVMTDWWADMNDVIKGGERSDKKTADMIRAQNDVYMVVNNNGAEINSNGDDTLKALQEGRLTLGEIQRSAGNICRFILKSPVIHRKITTERIVEVFHASQEQRERVIDSKYCEHGYRIEVNDRTTFGIWIDMPGTYSIVTEISSRMTDLAQSTSRVLLNGVCMITIQTNGTQGNWITQKLQKVKLEVGFYEMTIEEVQSGLEIRSIEFWR